MPFEPRRYVVMECLISAAFNAGISAFFTMLVFAGRESIGLWGGGGLALDFVPQTFMGALMSAMVPSFLTIRRMRAGKVSAYRWPLAHYLPRTLALRSILIAIAATVVLGGVALSLTAALWEAPLSFAQIFPAKVAYGTLVGIIVTPIGLRAALAIEQSK